MSKYVILGEAFMRALQAVALRCAGVHGTQRQHGRLSELIYEHWLHVSELHVNELEI